MGTDTNNSLKDSCTSAGYTIDKRCYVKEKNTTTPYNSVVKILAPNVIKAGGMSTSTRGCTGTIVQHNNKFMVYTAKHCVADDDIYIPIKKIQITTQNNLNTTAELLAYGDSVQNKNNGDWAIYEIIDKENLPYITLDQTTQPGEHMLAGYGSLKIMSDDEIKNFKNDYANFMKTKNIDIKSTDIVFVPNEDASYGMIPKTNNEKTVNLDNIDTGINIYKEYPQKFLEQNTYDHLFKDYDNFKYSRCIIDTLGRFICQAWRNDSGGPVFKKNGQNYTLTGIHSKGHGVIGGSKHAKYTNTNSTVIVKNIKYMQNIENDNTSKKTIENNEKDNQSITMEEEIIIPNIFNTENIDNKCAIYY